MIFFIKILEKVSNKFKLDRYMDMFCSDEVVGYEIDCTLIALSQSMTESIEIDYGNGNSLSMPNKSIIYSKIKRVIIIY